LLDMETLVETYGKAIYGLCRKLTQNPHDADDLYQQTFLTATEKTFREAENPKALLTKICLSHYKNQQRKFARRLRIAPASDVETEHISAPVNLEQDFAKKEQYAALRQAVANLEERLRIPTLLYYAMELPLKEIAKLLSIPEGTVKSRLSAARKTIKEELEVNGFDGQTI